MINDLEIVITTITQFMPLIYVFMATIMYGIFRLTLRLMKGKYE